MAFPMNLCAILALTPTGSIVVSLVFQKIEDNFAGNKGTSKKEFYARGILVLGPGLSLTNAKKLHSRNGWHMAPVRLQ